VFKVKQTIVVLIVFLLAACGPYEDATNIQLPPQCIEQQSACSVAIATEQLNILFNVESVIAESSFNIILDYQGSKKIEQISGYLEGEDMFMGKIPLFFTPNRDDDDIATAALGAEDEALGSQKFNAETMLGSCSQEQMLWRMWLIVRFKDKPEDKHTRSITFSSRRY
jgi:hypothetical protein